MYMSVPRDLLLLIVFMAKPDPHMKILKLTVTVSLFLMTGLQAHAQTDYRWGISARGGASTYRYGKNAIVKQRFLLPSYGLSGLFEKNLYKQLFLRAYLGYNNRGTSSNGDAVTDTLTLSSLGEYRNRLRDHFASNDLLLHYQFGRRSDSTNPFFQAGVRNEYYLFSNYSSKGTGNYFPDEPNYYFKSSNYRPLITGMIASVGVQSLRFEIGLEYYYQITNLLRYPQNTTVNFNKQSGHSVSVTMSYRFY